MSFKVVNKVDRDFRWDNGSNPYGFNVPFPTTEDNGKVLSVVEGKYALATSSSGEETIYFNLRLNTSESTLSVTDTEYTVSQINSMVYSYITPIVLRVQYDETDVYRLFSLYRVEATNNVTKWCSTVSTDDSGVEIYNDLINITDNGTLTFYRRAVKNLTAGENINITNNVISATIPEETVTLLYSLSNNAITDGYGANMPINDDNYDEIIIEIGAIPNMSANQYTLLKGGCWREQNNTMNSKYLRGIKSKVPSSSPLWDVIQPYMFDNLVVYSEINDPIDNTKHRFGLYATSYKDNGNTIIALQCVADDINVCLFPNNNVYVWGIKK